MPEEKNTELAEDAFPAGFAAGRISSGMTLFSGVRKRWEDVADAEGRD
ncbi:MAG: hypothetical protein IKS32_03305 [Solobacterium sp.]|nr:hypothetical protein [Solobacterium sp.]